jgi:A/G-specific adenine glycosylase
VRDDQDAAGMVEEILGWYAESARDLPWRRPGTSPWAVLVSEMMLQQTPVARVLPAYDAWLARWPTPAALAAVPSGEAVRQWGRLGYPRRALRLHEAATAIVERHQGAVPSSVDELLALPGVGAYTARALASFAFRQRHPVVDTNVRRVLARVVDGDQEAPGLSATVRERTRMESLLPSEPEAAATFSVALMELGALVCVARAPRCPRCPIAHRCAWVTAGSPPAVRRPGQGYAGTDRQVRGRLLAVLRAADDAVAPEELAAVWDEEAQRERALAGLVTDGLAARCADGRYALPG